MMAEFYVDSNKLETNVADIANLKAALDRLETNVYSVRGRIGFDTQSASVIKENLKRLAEKVGDESKATELLSSKLMEIIAEYRMHEQRILENAGTHGAIATTYSGTAIDGESIPGEGVTADLETDTEEGLTVENAIEFLRDLANGTSMSTSIDGVVLAVVEYLIKLYDMSADTGLLTTAGAYATGIGLITGVAADIMAAMVDPTISRNALIADLIVDVALTGVGMGTQKLGEVVGTAVGGPVGLVVGNFVGGMVGNGVSIAMNIDWNGDAEGGCGKDALSDWIDNQLDKFWEDGESGIVLNPA